MQLEREWQDFKTHNIKPTASAEAVILAKRAFMGGAFVLLQLAESANGSARDEERIEAEAESLRTWVREEAMASRDGGTIIDPKEWTP